MKEKKTYIQSNQEFGKKLKLMRRNTYLTQANVADQLGIERSTYSYYETGKTFPRISILTKLTEVFDCDFNALFYKKSH